MGILRRDRAYVLRRLVLAVALGALGMSGTPVTAGLPAAFAAQVSFPTGTAARSVAMADFNGDGKPDLAVANLDSDTVGVLLDTTPTNASSPTFAAQQTFATGSSPRSVAVADFNSDGKPDLAVANNSGAGGISVLLNTTPANASVPSFAPQQTFDAVGGTGDVSVADVNGDGTPDLVVANSDSSTVSVLLDTTPQNASTASFAPQQTFAVGSSPISVAVGDFNGDNAPDLAVANFGSSTVGVLLNTLHNTITATGGTPQSTPIGTAFPAPLTVHVADGVGQPLPGVTVTFTVPTSGASGTFTGGVTTVQATTNANGNLDTPPVFTANTTLGAYSVTASVEGASAPATFSLTNAPGLATHFSVTAPTSATAGVAVSVTVTALDQFGNTATGYTGTVQFTSTDTLATLPANSAFMPGDAGVQTVSVTFGSAGTQTITATDTVRSSISGTSNSITVAPVATTTTLTINPPTAPHGSPVTLTATLAPANATTLPTPTGSVAFTDGSTPLGTAPLVGGVATLSTNTLTVGLHQITATYTPASPGPYTTSQDTKDATITPAALVSISVTPSAVTLKVGQQQAFTATATYADGSTQDITNAVTWASDNDAVAHLATTGTPPMPGNTAVAQAPGTAHITATQGGISGQASVTVGAPTLTGVQPAPAPASRPAGTTSEPSVTPAPSGTGRGGTTTGGAPIAAPPGR
jgi:hypothetical protein